MVLPRHVWIYSACPKDGRYYSIPFGTAPLLFGWFSESRSWSKQIEDKKCQDSAKTRVGNDVGTGSEEVACNRASQQRATSPAWKKEGGELDFKFVTACTCWSSRLLPWIIPRNMVVLQQAYIYIYTYTDCILFGSGRQLASPPRPPVGLAIRNKPTCMLASNHLYHTLHTAYGQPTAAYYTVPL